MMPETGWPASHQPTVNGSTNVTNETGNSPIDLGPKLEGYKCFEVLFEKTQCLLSSPERLWSHLRTGPPCFWSQLPACED